jgi:hypothetical protein
MEEVVVEIDAFSAVVPSRLARRARGNNPAAISPVKFERCVEPLRDAFLR